MPHESLVEISLISSEINPSMMESLLKNIRHIHPVVFILIATILEVSGDAIVRNSIYKETGMMRIALMLIGGLLLFAYGFSLNLAPVEFGQVVGLYIAVLFVVWQTINYFAYHTIPTLPTVVGGLFIVTGGLIVTFWK